MSFLLNIVSDLSSFESNVQSTLDQRIADMQSKALTLKDSQGQNIFTADSIANFSNVVSQFKTSLDPRLSQQTSGQLNQGNTFFADTEYFSTVQTSDAWQLTLQGDYLRGLVGSKSPVLPMIFNIIPPISLGNDNPINPLFLFINPRTWTRSSTKVQHNAYVRGGIKTERWGEEMDQIVASGDIGAYYTQETGLTRMFRNLSPSFRNLLQVIQTYRNNGYSFGTTLPGGEVAPTIHSRILDVGYVEILYGYELFSGSFDSFTLKEAANRPFTASYSFTFNVAKSISIHDITDASTDITSNSTVSGIRLSPGQQQINTDFQSEMASRAIEAQTISQQAQLVPNNSESNFQTQPDLPVLLKRIGQ